MTEENDAATTTDPLLTRIEAIIDRVREAQRDAFEPHLRALRQERIEVSRERETVAAERASDQQIVEAGLRSRLNRIEEAELSIQDALESLDRRLALLEDEPPGW